MLGEENKAFQSLILLLVRNNKVLPCMEKRYVMPNGLVVKPRGQLTNPFVTVQPVWRNENYTAKCIYKTLFILFYLNLTALWYDIHPAFLFSDTGKDTPSRGEVL